MTGLIPRQQAAAESRWVGRSIDRADGWAKTTGSAPYPSDVTMPGMVHAALVTSTIACGLVDSIDIGAETLPGVLAVFTHENFPQLNAGPQVPFGWTPPPPLQDNRVQFYGQPVAVVVAESIQQATEVAARLNVSYQVHDSVIEISDAESEPIPHVADTERGDVAAGLARADVRLERAYATAENGNNPLGLMGAVAAWSGDRLDMHDTTQWPTLVRLAMATMFGVPVSGVRIRVPYLGGGFGAGLIAWHYKILAAGAARQLSRPVKLMLTRPQMFTQVGHRPPTEQTVRLGATRDGALTAIDHRAVSLGAVDRVAIGMITPSSAELYRCPNVTTQDRTVLLNRRYPGAMRGPGEAEGNFALEVALDELAYTLSIDPVKLRLVNFSAHHPHSGLPWSSNALRDCYRVGAERFGWADRDPQPRSMRSGADLVGWGMATGSYTGYQLPCSARITINADGTAAVRSAATDIGTGTYTVMAQLSADALALDISQVSFDLGDTEMPASAQSGGSALALSLGQAIANAVDALLEQVLKLARSDPSSPLHSCRRQDVHAADGGIRRRGDSDIGEAYAEILVRHGLSELTAEASAVAPEPGDVGMAQAGAFGARFVEVRIDPLIGRLRVTRVVTVNDAGRLLNEKLARSQIIGGTVGGVGMALLEEVSTDPHTGRIANATLGDYLVPVHADIPEIDAVFVGQADRWTTNGAKGVGEIGLIGVAAAVANAVYHATGRRFRDLPIHIEDLLERRQER